MPSDGNHQVDADVNGNEVCDEVSVAEDGAEHTLAGAGDHARRPVQVVHPAGDGFAPCRCHDRWPHDHHWQVATLLHKDVLGQRLGERVGVRTGAN